jgi:DegV family protein with EDD domain
MISLVTDSTADLPPDLVAKYHVTVVPSGLILGGQSYRDGVDLTRDEFYKRLSTFAQLPTTAAPGAGEFEAAFRACPDGPVISIHTAANLSGLYNAARLGAEPLADQVTVVDSGSLSMGVGFQVLAAAEAIAAGADLSTTLEAIRTTRTRLRVFALLETIDNLRKGGRISLVRASVATILRIKPLIELTDGTPIQLATERTRSKALTDLYKRVGDLGRLERLAIIYTDDLTLATTVRDQIAPQSASPVLIVQAAPTIGTHIGPGAVAVVLVK